MALRSFCFVLALSMLIGSGCRNQSNYRPACCPAVAAVPACPAPCPSGPVPLPPPPGVLLPR
jgi:hypothetical protein